MKAFAVLLSIMLMSLIAPMLFAANLWQDNFDDGALNAAYEMHDGGNGIGPPQWVEEDGVVKQIEPKPGDPTYLAVDLGTNIDFCGQLVRIRFDEWEDHDRSRAGIGFWVDPDDNFGGYTTLIHNSLTAGNFQFLNDARAWHGDILDFDTGGVGSWFWMRAEIDANAQTLVGKAWTGDLSDEPAGWMTETDYTTFGDARPPNTWVGLNGGAGTADGLTKVSFDDWFVYDMDGLATTAVSSQGKLATTWGEVRQ